MADLKRRSLDLPAAATERPTATRWIALPFLWVSIAASVGSIAYFARGWLPYVVFGVLVVAVFGWILVSALSPGAVRRRCPRCGEEGLRPISRGRSLGVRCGRCDFHDPDAHVPYLFSQ